MCAGCSINGRDFFSASPGRCRRLENSSNVQFIKKINCFLEGRTYRHRVPSVGYRDCGVGGWDQRLCVPSLEASSVFTICAAEARASPPSMSWHSRSVHQSHRQVTVHHLRITSLDPPPFGDFHSMPPGALSSIMSFPPSYTPS
ncbi:uncharacterized protein [Zea mays]|uniref:uncharacterized protein isoform X2 n=1 Tax=Zea mays TaxID=4577 RepID=UPI0009A9F234|nr:uncharacterized protein LOC103654190 isoform X2 [Zea mays]|eukprot:XP_020408325.1 uncharacterized protein LOC103654190 isoform X2 [Zea mays]